MSRLNDQVRAEIAARAAEIPLQLTADHWGIIQFALDYFERNQAMCNLRTLVRESPYDKMTVYRLFPGNPVKRICYLTGLPMPPEC